MRLAKVWKKSDMWKSSSHERIITSAKTRAIIKLTLGEIKYHYYSQVHLNYHTYVGKNQTSICEVQYQSLYRQEEIHSSFCSLENHVVFARKKKLVNEYWITNQFLHLPPDKKWQFYLQKLSKLARTVQSVKCRQSNKPKPGENQSIQYI